MVTEIEILETALVPLFGKEVMNDNVLKPIIEKEAKEIIDLEMEYVDEGPWKTMQHDDPSLPHGFIYYSCNQQKLLDLLHAIDVHFMLKKNPLRI